MSYTGDFGRKVGRNIKFLQKKKRNKIEKCQKIKVKLYQKLSQYKLFFKIKYLIVFFPATIIYKNNHTLRV